MENIRLPIAKGAENGYNRAVVQCYIAVLSSYLTRMGPWGVASTLRPARYRVSPIGILHHDRKDCKPFFENLAKKWTSGASPEVHFVASGALSCHSAVSTPGSSHLDMKVLNRAGSSYQQGG